MGNARAAVELAEREPLLDHRGAVVRAAIMAAGEALDAEPDGPDAPLLRARLMLRLAAVAMVEVDHEAAEQALAAAIRVAPDGPAGDGVRGLAEARGYRVALRRNHRAEAMAGLTAFAEGLPASTADTWPLVALELALALAELAVQDDPPAAEPFDTLAEILGRLAGDPERVDDVFVARRLIVAFAMSTGDGARAIGELREMIKLAVHVDANADEAQARLTVASLLTLDGSPIAIDEARHHLELAKLRATAANDATLLHGVLMAEAGLLSKLGRTADAIDRMLELARGAAHDQDLPRYVAAVGMMAQLYTNSGDVVSAFRTIVESHAALSNATGEDTSALFRPLLQTFRDQVGAERLAEIVADVDRANRLAAEVASKKPKHPS